MEKRAYGAMIPDEISWQSGKSPASIRFINDAEELMAQSNSDIDRCLLREAIEKIKIGDLVLQNFKRPEDFLEEWHEKFNEYIKKLNEKNKFSSNKLSPINFYLI